MDDNKKFPKSKSGLQCLTPCIPANQWSLNPITFRYHRYTEPYCHVFTVDDGIEKEIDKCYNPISIDEYKNMQLDMMYPELVFDCRQFLYYYNDIKNLSEGIEYLENKKSSPIETRARIVNCLLKEYIKEIDIIDKQFSNFFVEYFKKKIIDKLYNEIGKYIQIINNKIVIGEPKNIDNNNKNKKIEYIIDKFINYEEVSKYLTRYIEKNKNARINEYIKDISLTFIKYIENKILVTLDNFKK